jgi:predicted RNA-binding Zn-ribbon protein involved in translation (DUF1610 family)
MNLELFASRGLKAQAAVAEICGAAKTPRGGATPGVRRDLVRAAPASAKKSFARLFPATSEHTVARCPKCREAVGRDGKCRNCSYE